MPYNTTAILPPDETTGTSALPLARIKKIIKLDEDIDACTPGASYLITIATEMFVQHLTEQAFQMARSERKPRRNIQYKDLANAVSRFDSLEFLSDVIPKTVAYNRAIQDRLKTDAHRDAKKSASSQILLTEQRNGSSNKEAMNGESSIVSHEDSTREDNDAPNGSSTDSDLEMAS